MNVSGLKSQVFPLIEGRVASMGYECLECILRSEGTSTTLSVVIDAPEGIEVGDCERVSRNLGKLLDEEDCIPGRYYLEVGSPGLERPLKTIEHYRRFVGREVIVKLSDNKKIKGLLSGVEDMDTIHIKRPEGDIAVVAFSDVRSGRLVYTLEKGEKKKHR